MCRGRSQFERIVSFMCICQVCVVDLLLEYLPASMTTGESPWPETYIQVRNGLTDIVQVGQRHTYKLGVALQTWHNKTTKLRNSTKKLHTIPILCHFATQLSSGPSMEMSLPKGEEQRTRNRKVLERRFLHVQKALAHPSKLGLVQSLTFWRSPFNLRYLSQFSQPLYKNWSKFWRKIWRETTKVHNGHKRTGG